MARPQITFKVDDRELTRLIRKTSGKGPVHVVADGVEYGLYVHEGTSRMAARPFLRSAVETHREGFKAGFRNVLTIEQAEKHVTTFAFKVEEVAKRNCPWDTGALMNSIHVVDGDQFGITFTSMRE